MVLVQIEALSVVIYSVRKFKTSLPLGEVLSEKSCILPVVLFYVLYEVLPILNLLIDHFSILYHMILL